MNKKIAVFFMKQKIILLYAIFLMLNSVCGFSLEIYSKNNIMVNTLSNKKYNIYERCLEEADKSRLRYRHGCIATYSGKIIASGSPIEVSQDPLVRSAYLGSDYA
jgi:hypothetical protein